MKTIAAVILHAPLGESEAERLVAQGRAACALDLGAVLHEAGMDRIIVITGDDRSLASLSCMGISMVSPNRNEPFHFGKAIQQVIEKERLEGLLYFGSGSGGLLTAKQVNRLITFARRRERGALFNNFYSCDFTAISKAGDLLGVELPARDNPLGLVLSDLGFPCFTLPREAATQFDIDTPTDLVLLTAAKRGGKAMAAFLEDRHLTHPAIPGLLDQLVDRRAHLYLIGRVNPITWSHFEQEVACRTSAFVEGRGLHVYADHKGTLLAQGLKELGVHRFFKWLSQVADAALIDSRPLLIQNGRLPPASDRFASDLQRPELIRDPLWALFTREAVSAEIPIVLGGHSLVSGGLYLLAEACWKDRDLPRRLHPDLIAWRKEQP